MAEPMTIALKTLTPLWTGGVDGKSDRLHVTGIIGSLRWWYEAIVRGLGGYVSDPTADAPAARSAFDTKAYELAKRDNASESEALREGIKAVCPVSYLFGATGWARLFQLQAIAVPAAPLHFRTTVNMNKNWLSRIFGGESQSIDNLQVPYGDLRLRFVPRGYDTGYATHQFTLALCFAAEYGGLGARLQHGFGQIVLTALPSEMQKVTIASGLTELANRLRSGEFKASGPVMDTPFDLRNFISLTYQVPASSLSAFTGNRAHLGNAQKRTESNYLPCAFDLRYKGSGEWGMRRWLENPNGSKRWRHRDANVLMGVSKKKGELDREEDRQAGRLCFGMPYRVDGGNYRLQVFGFAPPESLTPEALQDLCNEYIDHVLNVQPINTVLGKDLLSAAKGGQQ
jgi:CRISPR-associated protein Cmr1